MADINSTTFLSGANAEFIAELYARFLDDPEAVDDSWRSFFSELGDDPATLRAERAGAPWVGPPIAKASSPNGRLRNRPLRQPQRHRSTATSSTTRRSIRSGR